MQRLFILVLVFVQTLFLTLAYSSHAYSVDDCDEGYEPCEVTYDSCAGDYTVCATKRQCAFLKCLAIFCDSTCPYELGCMAACIPGPETQPADPDYEEELEHQLEDATE